MKCQRKNLFLVSFTNQSSPGIHAKYIGIQNAAKRKGWICSMYEHRSGLASYFALFSKVFCIDTDVFWFRYNLERSPFILLYSLIVCLRKKRLIIEVPTAFSSHIKMRSMFWGNACYYILVPAVFALANRVKVYSRENGYLKVFKEKMNLIGNGIDIDRVCLKAKSNSTGNGLNMVVAATLAPWHGVDILLTALYKIKNHVPFMLHVVGDGPEYDRLIALTDRLGLNDLVFFYGMLDSKKLQGIYELCNLAVGTLNWESIGITESSPIKNREYSMAGLPFIHAGYDIDYNESRVSYRVGSSASLEISSEIAELLIFIYKKNCLPKPIQCHEYANDRLTYDVKIEAYLA